MPIDAFVIPHQEAQRTELEHRDALPICKARRKGKSPHVREADARSPTRYDFGRHSIGSNEHGFELRASAPKLAPGLGLADSLPPNHGCRPVIELDNLKPPAGKSSTIQEACAGFRLNFKCCFHGHFVSGPTQNES